MAYGTVNADVIGTSVAGSNLGAGNASLMKNRIINGAMVIDQRNAGASVTQNAAGIYTLDRWQAYGTITSKFSVQQNKGSVTPPVGFKNYLGGASLSAYAVLASDIFIVQQSIEGYNIADLGWGTASAKTVTLSFQVYSSLTGTFGGSLNGGNSRSYPFSYSIPVANTWTTISVTVAGDTTGTWGSTNGNGIIVNFSLGTGSTYSGTAGAWAGASYYSATGATSVVGTSGATFYITGVQLEVGSSATGFEYRQYGQELALCKRYCRIVGLAGVGAWDGTTTAVIGYSFNDSEMRSSPTATISTSTPTITQPGVADRVGSGSTISSTTASVNGVKLNINGFTGATNQNIAIVITSNLAVLSAEL